MSQKDIWKEFITAQSKILEFKSRPFSIDPKSVYYEKGKILTLSIDQEIFKNTFKKEVEEIFQISNFNFNDGYILANPKVINNITEQKLDNLNQLADTCYVDFNVNPVIDGYIYNKNSNIEKILETFVGEIPNNYGFKNHGQIFLTHTQKEELTKVNEISIANKAAAIFQIKPNLSFIISTFYKEIYVSQYYNKILLKGELQTELFNKLNSIYILKHYRS